MRLLAWNINGIRTLPSYHPWNTLKTGENILNELGADIICFQEMKATRQTIDRHFAVPSGYDAFFSFPVTKGGYSGVGVFTKSSTVVPLKAEEGLSGHLQSGLKPPLAQDERVLPSYPLALEIELMPDEAGTTPNDLLELDQEGRAIVLDFGLFVLINLYCPNETSDARLPYKMNFHLLLAELVRRLIETEKREVIVTGDINICAAPIDHCDGELASKQDEFWIHPARRWFREWLHPRGPMTDVVRSCWPERKGMFTCWNTKISARESNYGTRIDHFLLTKGLLPWFKHGDIQPSIKGSDHCPVYIDLHDEIVTENGEKLTLKQMMKMDGEKRDAPRLASKHWDEYSGKQKLLSNFFGKKAAASLTQIPPPSLSPPVPPSKPFAPQTSDTTPAKPITIAAESSEKGALPTVQIAQTPQLLMDAALLTPTPPTTVQLEGPLEQIPALPQCPPTNLAASSSKSSLSNGDPSTRPSSLTPTPVPTPSPITTITSAAEPKSAKRKKMQADSNYPAQPTKKAKGAATTKGKDKGKSKGKAPAQSKLSSFFAASSSQGRTETEVETEIEDDNAKLDASSCADVTDVDMLIGSDDFGLPSSQLSASPISVPGSSQNGGQNGKTHAWSTLFARLEPPKCVVHGEPAREFTVNKPGPNKGKTFFVCSRPVGPGYDAGKDKRLREEVDPRYKCGFFKWSSEVKREALQGAQKKS